MEREAKIAGSRFSHGLPPASDGQMLFLSHVVHKLKDEVQGSTKGGRAGVVTNSSPLFTGGPGSGADNIRSWLINSDLIDAIIALPTDMFYNTPIATYVWVLDKNKEPHRRGKIQLIDATSCWSSMFKGMGKKQREFTDADRQDVLEIYKHFENSDPETSRIVTPNDLGYIDVPIFKALRYSTLITDETVLAALSHPQALDKHETVVRSCKGVPWNELPTHLRSAAKKAGTRMSVGLLEHIMSSIAVEDPVSPQAVDHKGNMVVDKTTKIIERLPLVDNIDEYMDREVAPYFNDFVWDVNEAKVGYEIPMIRYFYKPEGFPDLDELDQDIQRNLSALVSILEKVQND